MLFLQRVQLKTIPAQIPKLDPKPINWSPTLHQHQNFVSLLDLLELHLPQINHNQNLLLILAPQCKLFASTIQTCLHLSETLISLLPQQGALKMVLRNFECCSELLLSI